MSNPANLLIATLLTAPLALASAPATAADPAEQGTSEPATVRVVVDAKAVGEPGPYFEVEVGKQVRERLSEAGYRVVERADADVTVRVRITYFNEEDLDYVVNVDISGGSAIERLEALGCAQCVDTDLLKAVAGQGDAVVAGVEATLKEREGVEEKGPEGDEPGEEEEKVAGLGVMGGVGIGVAALGVGGVIGGAVELARGKVYDEPTKTPGERTFVDHTMPGAVVTGVGVALVGVGTALIVVDVVRRAKRQKAKTRALIPAIGPAFVGLGYVQQF